MQVNFACVKYLYNLTQYEKLALTLMLLKICPVDCRRFEPAPLMLPIYELVNRCCCPRELPKEA